MIVVLARDLIVTSRIAEAASRAGSTVLRIDDPADLPEPDRVRRLLVDWDARQPDWAAALRQWCDIAGEAHRPEVVLFGPHTDLEAHREARAAGLGPMLARSRMISRLPELVGG